VAETSAGGLAVDLATDPPRAAVIGRLDRSGTLLWSLPKGHVEPGETLQAAAIREVAEETGITGRVLADLGSISFWFIAGRRRVHKTVHHFLLAAEGGTLSNADPEVNEVAWVPVDDLAGVLAYEDERGIVAKVPPLLAEHA
jgi:8-oxo-dGTP pyrophosphatase MutT (NUDIX family)